MLSLRGIGWVRLISVYDGRLLLHGLYPLDLKIFELFRDRRRNFTRPTKLYQQVNKNNEQQSR